MFNDNCPLCGTRGRQWTSSPDAFVCPNCASIYSRFGLIIESQDEQLNHWN